MASTNLDTALRYLRALEEGATGEALTRFFHPDVVQREYPNRLTTHGKTRDLKALCEAAERGQKAVSSQTYAVRHAMEAGDTVAIEADWSATLKVPLGSLPAGGTMRAALGMFLTFRDGLIVSQRNYDCFEPF